MKYLYLLFLSFSFHLKAFQYEPSNLSFSESSYRRYIKPQFKNLIQDYQTLFKILSPHEEQAYDQIKLHLDWLELNYQLNSKCFISKMNRICLSSINDTYAATKKTLIHLENISRNIPFSNMVKIKSINKLTQLGYRIEDLTIKLKTAANNKIRMNYLNKLATEIATFLEQYQKLNLFYLPKVYKEQISLVELNFLIPIINNFIADDKSANLYTLTKDLNKSFHNFLMEMLKKGKPVPPKARVLLEVMQRRWNSVLKIVVKR